MLKQQSCCCALITNSRLPDDLTTGSLALVNISASVPLGPADMTIYLKKISRGEAVEGQYLPSRLYGKASLEESLHLLLLSVDVLEVLSEVDEKSRRCPEMIQYFIVSQTRTLRVRR